MAMINKIVLFFAVAGTVTTFLAASVSQVAVAVGAAAAAASFATMASQPQTLPGSFGEATH